MKSMRFAILFPGQGAQFVGMGADLFDARPDLLGERADAVLGWSLRKLCLDGPDDELTRTDRAQPALHALSYAAWTVLAEALDHSPAAAAGHSLGEYTALAAAGAVDFETGLRLVALRGRAMAAAAEQEPSGMAALLGADLELAESIAAGRRDQGGRLWVANVNAPGQVVASGAVEDLDWLGDNARDLGLRRVVRLNVAGGFHSPFMAPAVPDLEAALRSVHFGALRFPVWANVSARPHDGSVAASLLDQLTATVRFSESVSDIAAAGTSTFIHVGPGDVTAGLARRTVPDAEVLVVSGPADVAETVQRLRSS